MRIRVVSVCYNEKEMLPWYLRYYADQVDEIIIYDDGSNDGSKDIARACPRVSLRDWKFPSGLIDDYMMQLWQQAIAEARNDGVDWLITTDIDEIMYHPDGLKAICAKADEAGWNVIQSSGWNMTSNNGLPVINTSGHPHQIWEVHKTGVRAPVYAKPIIVKPTIPKLNWNRGRHALENCDGVKLSPPLVKLLHYRYLGYDYTKKRNARNYERVGPDKGCAWSNAPTYKGEHSAEWASFAHSVSLNAITAPL